MLFPKSLLLFPKQELVFRDIFLVHILKNAAKVVMILLVYFKYSGLNFLSFFSAVCSFCQFSMLRRSCSLDIYLLVPRRLRGSIITFFLTIVFFCRLSFVLLHIEQLTPLLFVRSLQYEENPLISVSSLPSSV